MANEFIARNGLISQNNSVVTGSLTVTQGITGSLFGTASWSNNSISSSFAQTALIAPDYLQLSSTSSMLEPYVLNSSTSSFVQNSQTSSMLEPYVLNSSTSSFVQNSQTSSMLQPYVLNSVTSSMSVLSSSFAATASYALNAGVSGGGTNLGLVVAISLGYQNLF
jgi:hypothetical protein